MLNVTGDQDICYYNFLCAHPLGVLSDFNHVYSNVGYVLLGLLFIGLVKRRDLMHQEHVRANDRYEQVWTVGYGGGGVIVGPEVRGSQVSADG